MPSRSRFDAAYHSLYCLAILARFSVTTTGEAPMVDAAAESHRRLPVSGLFLPCDVALEELALPLSWTTLVLPMKLRGFHTPETFNDKLCEYAARTCAPHVGTSHNLTADACAGEIVHAVVEWVADACGRAPARGAADAADTDDTPLTADEFARVVSPPLYFINLARRPDRAAHMRAQLAKSNATARFDVRRFNAFDGRTYEFSPAELILFVTANFMRYPNDMTSTPVDVLFVDIRAYMGNMLSHFRIWEQVATGDAPYAVVLQDDVVVHSDFVARFDALLGALPPDAWVVWLGLHRVYLDPTHNEAWPIEEPYDPDTYSRRLDVATDAGTRAAEAAADAAGGGVGVGVCEPLKRCQPCSGAYLLMRHGARQLVAHVRSRGGFESVTDILMNKLLLAHDRHYIARPLLATTDPHFGTDIFTSMTPASSPP